MRHAFSFPIHIRQAVQDHVNNAIDRVSPQRFYQEPTYVSALASQLEGKVYDDSDGFVEFRSTIMADRGPNSAENLMGSDFAITAVIGDGIAKVEKAILIQAKIGSVSDLAPSKRKDLIDQIYKMKHFTRSPKVMEIADHEGGRFPAIISGNKYVSSEPYEALRLGDYFVRRVLTTLDGDTRKPFVETVQNSRLTKLQILAKVKP